MPFDSQLFSDGLFLCGNTFNRKKMTEIFTKNNKEGENLVQFL